MTVPVNMEKELNDWTFDELCNWAAWQVTQSLLAGRPLKSAMYSVLDVARQWNPKRSSDNGKA